jgi:hypothetical protein
MRRRVLVMAAIAALFLTGSVAEARGGHAGGSYRSGGSHSSSRSYPSHTHSSYRSSSSHSSRGSHLGQHSSYSSHHYRSASSGGASHSHRSAAYSGARDAHGRLRRSTAAKDAFKREHPCPSTGQLRGACPGYVIDHVVALKRGGPDSPSNMQWQTTADAKAKDKVE